MNAENLKIKELSSKCKSILEEEAKHQGIELIINPITIVEFYNSDFFKKQNPTKLQRVKIKYNLRKSTGIFDSNTEKIMIFIDRIAKGLKVDSSNKFTSILFAMYHEYKHQLQKSNKVISNAEKFIIEIENFMMALNPKDYRKNYGNYFIEIDANLYAYTKTLEYIQENDPTKYEDAKRFIEARWLSQTKYYQINYDFQKTFDKFYKFCKSKRYAIIFLGIPQIDNFIDISNEFKPLSKIITSFKKENIDESILLAVLGSESFLNQLDISKLTQEEKQIMYNIINKILENEEKRIEENIQYYQERKIQSKEYLKSLNCSLEKIKYLNLELRRFRKYLTRKVTNISSEESYYKKLQRIKSEISSSNFN